ncbi:MAG: alkene reductase [Bryobacteraceae bacterium]|nr:alkene reductase [Bryobacteraceae bacterium]
MFQSTQLFSPLRLGELNLKNRILMAPMTRNRAHADGTPSGLMAEHYAQRAGAGLIITEMTVVSEMGVAYLSAPGLYRDSHRAGWRQVTERVHEAGGLIVAQIAHAGRVSHPSLLPGDSLPVAPSPIRPAGRVYTRSRPQPFETPRALDSSEIPSIVTEFALASRMAFEAGFDGVELHAANGYLLDQFLRDGTNQRTDSYGGSVANRLRLLLESVGSAVAVWGQGRVGVRISPFNPFKDIADSNPRSTFAAVADALSGMNLAYLHVVEPVTPQQGDRLTPELRRRFQGGVIVNGGFDLALAEDAIHRGEADAISFGAPFMANPDLPTRFAHNLPLAVPDTFYTGGARGYTDYPPHRLAA